jgi:geranylgeranyl diphosphate synthase type I
MADLFPNAQALTADMRSMIHGALTRVIDQSAAHDADTLREMLAYQMGWEGEGSSSRAEGKKIRPLLVTLTADASEGRWQQAVPAAAAVELVHNFSLIHDDIEDQSETRRGRPTIWKKWGIAPAINAGDAMFSLASLALLGLQEHHSPKTVLDASQQLHQTCLRLTQGQHLDLAFESLAEIPLESYWQMVGGKTAALLSCSTELGAISAGADPDRRTAYQQFGHYLGLAYQAQDDILGIWGEKEKLGKSTAGDLVSGKLTLPVIFGLTQDQEFKARWRSGPIKAGEVPDLARRLEEIGSRAYAQSVSDRLTDLALSRLESAHPSGESGAALHSLARTLLNRQS